MLGVGTVCSAAMETCQYPKTSPISLQSLGGKPLLVSDSRFECTCITMAGAVGSGLVDPCLIKASHWPLGVQAWLPLWFAAFHVVRGSSWEQMTQQPESLGLSSLTAFEK